MQNSAVFLDRDGVINEDLGFVHKIDDLKFVPKVFDALAILSKSQHKIIIVTSQSGIGRGIYTEEDYKKFMDYMLSKFKEKNIRIDAHFFCPHHPTEAKIAKYKINCDCRKPKTGMIERAKKIFNIDLRSSWVVGDKTDDIKMGENAGCKTILVKTGKSGNDGHFKVKPDYVATDLLEAVKIILDSKSNPI